MDRVVRQELLDDTTPEASSRSLSDLVRINRFLGGHEVLRKRLHRLFAPQEPFHFLDIGSASGDAGEVVRSMFPKARVTSVDYRSHHLRRAAPLRVVADAFALPFAYRAFDVVHCSLFLHHFEDQIVVRLLRDFGRLARRCVVVNDLERHPIPYYFLPATRWLFRWDAITLHDGPVSVQAAFRAHELRALAKAAGLSDIDVQTHRPAFRISMVARPGSDIFAS
jgi:ubiquinone/menaquinone biosynthesis C-methylase UbiE